MRTQIASKVIALMMAALPLSASAKVIQIDPASSTIKWVGKKVTGQHNGTISLKSGEVDLEKDKINGGNFVIDMTSIKVTDIADKENNAKLTGHLKSDDFFGVEKNPTSTFKITSVKQVKGQKGATHEISGELTVKGVTEKLTFPAWVEVKGDKASAKGTMKVDRTKYNVKYGSGKFFDNLGDKMIYDDFEIELDLKTK